MDKKEVIDNIETQIRENRKKIDELIKELKKLKAEARYLFPVGTPVLVYDLFQDKDSYFIGHIIHPGDYPTDRMIKCEGYMVKPGFFKVSERSEEWNFDMNEHMPTKMIQISDKIATDFLKKNIEKWQTRSSDLRFLIAELKADMWNKFTALKGELQQ